MPRFKNGYDRKRMTYGEKHILSMKGEESMHAYMTNGTIDFLLRLQDKHPDLDFYFMSGSGGGLAYYEGEKNIFVSGRGFDILIESGRMQKEGFVVMNNIPTTDEGKHILENNFQKRDSTIELMPGFQAFRFLRPIKGDTYVVMTQWRSDEDYNHWKESEQFQEAHKDMDIKKPAYIPKRPFTSTYHMYTEEET